MKNSLLVTPGYVFYEQDDKMSPYIRLSYSMIKSNQIDRVSVKCFHFISKYVHFPVAKRF